MHFRTFEAFETKLFEKALKALKTDFFFEILLKASISVQHEHFHSTHSDAFSNPFPQRQHHRRAGNLHV